MRRLRRLFRPADRLLRFLLVRHRAITVLVSLFITAIIFAFANGFWLTARLANISLAALFLAYLWSRLNLRGLEVTVERPSERLQVGAPFEERITVRNRDFFTKLWLEIQDGGDLPGHRPQRVISLGPRATRSWRTVSECTRRGLFTVGPVRITSGDLFGVFRRSKTFGTPSQVLVYPRAEELHTFALPPALLPGEGRRRRPSQSITPTAAGVREYAPGDSYNRIHWRTTARTGELMVKLFELDPASDVWLVLDLHGVVQAGDGNDGTEEHAVRAAASIARYFLMGTRSLGFLALGDRYHVVEPARGLGQFTRVLEALALANAQGDLALAELLNRENRRFGRHTTVVVATPSTDEAWVASLQQLASRGVKTAAVVLEPRTFGGSGNALLVFSALAAAGVLTYLVKQSDDLPAALGSNQAAAVSGGAS
jgi:uncharacterized protein (DUF58 family)